MPNVKHHIVSKLIFLCLLFFIPKTTPALISGDGPMANSIKDKTASIIVLTGPVPGCVNGDIFDDINGNGIEDLGEIGASDIEIEVYDDQNILVGNTISDSNGDWSVCGLIDGNDYRIEFKIPTSLSLTRNTTHAGNDNGTDVQFVTAPACTKFSVLNPIEYCEEDPNIIVNCYVRGAYNDPNVQSHAAIVSLPNSSAQDVDGNINGTTTEAPNPFNGPPIYAPQKPAPDVLVTFGEVGTVWGMAKARGTNTLYTSSYIKAGTSLGPGESTGLIYKTEDPTGNSSTSAYVDLNVVFGTNTAGTDPHPLASFASYYPADTTTNIHIGKVGLGDMDISKDEDSLYIVNLYDRMLYQIPTSGALNSSTIQRYSIPTTGLPTVIDAAGTPGTCPPVDMRPFGTAIDAQGTVYVGAVCSCESISAGMDAEPNNASYQMTAYVWKFDGSTFTLVLDESLRFNRDDDNTIYSTYDTHFTNGGFNNLDWEPWSDLTVATGTQMDQNEPMLSDIEFDDAGNMILGFRDRSGDIQSIYTGFSSSGDIYKACPTGTGTWEFENNGICGGTSSAGVNNNEGPGGGEFYYMDKQADDISNSGNGGLLVIPGTGQVISSATDPVYHDSNGNEIFVPSTGGIQVYSNSNGELDGAYNFYEIDSIYSLLKASGIGDVEACCAPAPIEIGNYVWCDSIPNGIQDASEKGVNNMIIQLYNAAGDLVGQDTTINGNYYFNEFNVDTTGISVNGAGLASPNGTWTGLDYNTKYYILFGNSQFDATVNSFTIAGETYSGITTFDANANANDNIDSDVDPAVLGTATGAMPADKPIICMTTAPSGGGDHTLDLGVTCPVYDWGDLPDTGVGTSAGNYNTTDSDMGPSHNYIPGLNIGSSIDSEMDGQPSTNALGDGSDEDGFSFPSTLNIIAGGTIQLPIDVTNTTGITSHLEIWIDWNNDGDFNDPGEMVTDLSDNAAGDFGQTSISIPIPLSAVPNQAIGFRARLSYQDNMTPNGSISSGEVEDYLITVLDCKPNICTPLSIIRK